MKAFFQILLKHPISIIFYGIYSWFCVKSFIAFRQYHFWLAGNHEHSISYGEGIGYLSIFLILFAVIFCFILLINAIARKQFLFYCWLVFIIFSQTIFIFNAF